MALTGDRGSIVEPGAARTSAEYVALLRQLKDDSGLTYRQLEQRAAERGEVLARSTLADVLRRDALPRAELVTALVRACGAERDEAEWLAARERLAAAPGPAGGDSGDDGGGDGDGDGGDDRGRGDGDGGDVRPRFSPRAVVAALGAVALLGIGIGAFALLPQDEGGERDAGPAAGVTRVRPALAPELCLTDGDVRSGGGEYKTVAVQRPCAEAVPPTTSLVRSDDGRYRIQWDHPSNGKGCLTVLAEGEFRNLLEPWDDCAVAGSAQLFRIERAKDAQGWLLHPAGDDALCVGVRGDPEAPGAAAVVEPCATTAAATSGQRFLIGPR